MNSTDERLVELYKMKRAMFPIVVINPDGYTQPAPEISDEDALFLARLAVTNCVKDFPRKDKTGA